MSFNFLGILKKLGSGLLAAESSAVGRMVTTAAISAIAPQATPFLPNIWRMMDNARKAIGSAELAYQDFKSGAASADKRQHVIDQINADLEMARDAADVAGYELTYDGDSVNRLIEKELDAINEWNTFHSSFTMTKKKEPTTGG